MEARRLVITGVVQGVGFRYYMVAEAGRLGITGWVRNRRDGSVEAEISGDPTAIAAMIHSARRGAPASRVAQVYVEQVESPLEYGEFSLRPTA